MAYTTPKKYTTGAIPDESAFLQRNRERYDISKPVNVDLTGTMLEQAKQAPRKLSMYEQMQNELITQKPVETKKSAALSFNDTIKNMSDKTFAFGSSIANKLGADAIGYFRGIQSAVESVQASAIGEDDKTRTQILTEAYKDIASGSDIVGGLKKIFGITTSVPVVLAAGEAAGKTIGNVARGNLDIADAAVKAIQDSGLRGILSRNAKTDVDAILKPLERELQTEAQKADEKIGFIPSTITGGIGSLPSSVATQAIPFKLGYGLMFIRSFRGAQEEAWNIEKSTGRKLSDKDVYLYALSNAGLEVGIEASFNKIGSSIGDVVQKATGGKYGVGLAKSDGWVKELFRKYVLKVGKDATGDVAQKIATTPFKQFLKDISEGFAGEGLEEIANAIGSAVVGKLTVKPDDTLQFNDPESSMYWKSILSAGLSGGFGGLFGVGGVSVLSNFLNEHGNKTVEEVFSDPQISSKLNEVLATSSQIESVQDGAVQAVADVVRYAETEAPIEQPVEEVTAQEPEAIQATTMPAEAPTMAQDAVEAQTQESTTPIAEAVAEPARAVEQYAGKDVGIHFGNLGKAEFLRNQTGTRNTGHFGTGTYFVSPSYAETMSKSRNYGERPAYSVNFSDYNLFKPQNSNKGLKFHDALRFLNNKITFNADRILNGEILEYNKIEDALYDWEETITDETPRGDNGKLSALDSYLIELYGQEEIEYAKETEPMWRKYEELVKKSERIVNNLNSDIEYFNDFVVPELSLQTGTSNNEILKIIKNVSKKYSKNGKIDFNTTEDTISTEVMKQLGYEGVDVRGLTGLDDEQYGSVIYDLKQPKPTPSKPVESELVKESQKADESGRIGIVAKGFEPQAETQEPKWKKTISEDTRKAIEKASTPYADKNVLQEIKDKLSKFREYVMLGSVPIETSEGDIRRLFREARVSDQYAKGMAENVIAKAYNKAGKSKQELLRYAILYLDIKEDLDRGLYDKKTGLMFNIKSPEEALKTAEEIQKELDKDENSLVREAMETRKRLMDEIRNELIAEGNEAGIDFRHVKAKNNYMYHAILEYREEFNQALRAKGAKKGNNRVEYLQRSGSVLDYLSDPLMADFLILQKLQKDTARMRLYNAIKQKDISKTLAYTEDNDWIIPVGYSELNPAKMGIVHVDAYDKSRIREIKSAELEKRGIDPKSAMGRKLIAKATTVLNKNTIVVPTQIVDAVVNEFNPRESASGKLTKKLMNVWKYTKIRLPNTVIKYNTRNFFGDLDAMIAGKPSAIRFVAKAAKELYGYFYRGGVLTKELESYVKRSGMTTGQTPQELKTFKSSSLIKAYEESTKTSDVAKRIIRRLWKALTLETFTNFREQVLRYATYLSYAQELTRKDSNGLPKSYAASIPAEIQSIKNPLDRAFKLSNDLIGAYDDVSIFGQWAADHLMPFFRFTEVNNKRYYRMIKNVFYNDANSMNSVAKDVVTKSARFARVGGVAMFRAAKLMVGISAFYGALALSNSLLAGDEEEELPEEVRNKPHITIPRWLTGSDRIYYIDRLGSFAELLDMYGLDYGLKSDLADVASGKKNLGDKLKEIALSPLYQLYNSSWPATKIVYELVTGKTYYPDPTKPSAIRDTWEYIFGQVGLKDEYKAIVGKPIAEGSYWTSKRNLLWNSVLPGDAALYDTMDMVSDYYAFIGESGTYSQFMDKDTDKYKRSQAAYYYKMALKLDDYKAAEKYLAEYVAYGGTKKTLKQTMQYIDPTAGMNASKRADFLEWLTPEQKERYDKGMEWYREILEASAEMEFPSE